jgi:hypothetical protein
MLNCPHAHTRVHTYEQAVLASMEEDVGIVLEEGVIVNRHSLRRILRGPADVEMIVRTIFVFLMPPLPVAICCLQFSLQLMFTYAHARTFTACSNVHVCTRMHLYTTDKCCRTTQLCCVAVVVLAATCCAAVGADHHV